DYIKIKHNLTDMPTSLSSSAMNSRIQALKDKGVLPLPVYCVVKAKIDGEVQVLYKKKLYLRSKLGGGFGFFDNPNENLGVIAKLNEFYMSRSQLQPLQQSGGAIYAGFYGPHDELKIFNQSLITFSQVGSLVQPPPILTQITTPVFATAFDFSGTTYR